MPSGLMTIIMPLSIIALMAKQKGPVRRMIKAGSISPETARRPATIGLTGSDLLHLPTAGQETNKSGVIVNVGDGRLYVDLVRYRRKRRHLLMTLGGLALLVVVIWLVVWPPF